MQNHDTCSYFSPLFCSSTFSSIHSKEKWLRLCSFCVKLEGKWLKQESMPWQEEKRSLMIYYNELFSSKVCKRNLLFPWSGSVMLGEEAEFERNLSFTIFCFAFSVFRRNSWAWNWRLSGWFCDFLHRWYLIFAISIFWVNDLKFSI